MDRDVASYEVNHVIGGNTEFTIAFTGTTTVLDCYLPDKPDMDRLLELLLLWEASGKSQTLQFEFTGTAIVAADVEAFKLA